MFNIYQTYILNSYNMINMCILTYVNHMLNIKKVNYILCLYLFSITFLIAYTTCITYVLCIFWNAFQYFFSLLLIHLFLLYHLSQISYNGTRSYTTVTTTFTKRRTVCIRYLLKWSINASRHQMIFLYHFLTVFLICTQLRFFKVLFVSLRFNYIYIKCKQK